MPRVFFQNLESVVFHRSTMPVCSEATPPLPGLLAVARKQVPLTSAGLWEINTTLSDCRALGEGISSMGISLAANDQSNTGRAAEVAGRAPPTSGASGGAGRSQTVAERYGRGGG